MILPIFFTFSRPGHRAFSLIPGIRQAVSFGFCSGLVRVPHKETPTGSGVNGEALLATHGGKLELSIDKVPLSFSFNDDFQFLVLVSWEKVYLLPQSEVMTVSYKVTGSNGVETKKGVLTIPDPNTIKGTRYYQSVRSATSEYLGQYDENIKKMARSAVDQLMAIL